MRARASRAATGWGRREVPRQGLHPIRFGLARFEEILVGKALQREGCGQALDLRARFRPIFSFEALFEEQLATQRREDRFEVGFDVEVAGEQLLQQLVSSEPHHRRRAFPSSPVAPRRETVTGSHL